MYKVVYDRKCIHTLASIPTSYHKLINAKIEKISNQPFEVGKKLKGKGELYSSRVGDYRIIYIPKKKELYVLIYKIAHRKEVYS